VSAPVRISHYPRRDGPLPAGAKWVGRPSQWGNPFKVRSKANGLARVPAVDHPGMPWEFEGRISAAGMRHDYFHPDGRVIRCDIRWMTAAECVECYRAWVTGGGWPLARTPRPMESWLDPLRECTALACSCPLSAPCHVDVLLDLLRGES